MGKIRHIAITAEDPFATAELFKKALGLEEISRGDSDLAREVYLTDGYGLDHFGVHVDNLEGAEAQARKAGAVSQPPPPVDLSRLQGNTIFFEKKLELAGVKFDLSGHGWAVTKQK